MKIVGTGIDIIENARIKKSIKNDLFVKRIYSKIEILNSKKFNDKTLYFSKKFAAKEAFVKSLGTGFKKGINFKDVSVINDKLGKPLFLISDKIKKIIKKKI